MEAATNKTAMLRLARLVPLVLLPVLVAFAQEPIDLPEEKIRCLRTELTEAGFAQAEIDALFDGKIADPESFVESRIGEDGIRAIGEACFPEDAPTPGGPTPTPEITITPEQRACVTKYLQEDLLDQMLRGEVRPEDVLALEQMQTIGQDCFAHETPPPGEEPAPVPHTIDLPPDVIECLTREVGEQAVREVSSGQRSPTPEEYAKGEKCSTLGPPGGGAGGIPDLPEATQQCIRGVIGDKFDRAMELVRTGGRPESLLTPEEMRKVGETCFSGTPGVHPGGPPGTGGPVPELPPGVRACLEGKFGPGRVAEVIAGQSQPTPEELQKAQECFGGTETGVLPEPSGPPGGTEGCMTQCTAYTRPDDGKFTETECQQMCQGGPGPDPSPGPTGPPDGGYDQCVGQCRTYEDGRYNVGDFCERACRGESVEPPGVPYPSPTSEPATSPVPPEPTPYPMSDTSQCVTSCTGYTYTMPDGTTKTYTAEECQQICSEGKVGGVETTRAAPAAPWPVRFLLRLLGF